jgi:riboflavin synthase
MFTGIIETIGKVIAISREGSNRIFTIESSISSELKTDQSVSHSGVCLTVTAVTGNTHTVTAVDETLKVSNLGFLEVGNQVNLERCMPANGRFDGHIVQGHVDGLAKVFQVQDLNGSWLFDFNLPAGNSHLIVEKGSVCINGVSLTVFNVSETGFRVTIIPYTYQHTTFSQLKPADMVNIEFDIIGKYVTRMLAGTDWMPQPLPRH